MVLQRANYYLGRVREAWLGIASVLWGSCVLVGCVGIVGAPGIGIKLLLGLFTAFAGVMAIQKGQQCRDYPGDRAVYDRRWYLFAVAELAVALGYVGTASILWADVLFMQCVLGIVLLSAWQIVRAAWGWLVVARKR